MASVNGFDNLPDITGTYHGSLAICASAQCIWKDLYSFAPENIWQQNFDIMAVNDIGMHLPHKLTHWFSNDLEMLPRWRAARRPRFSVEGRFINPYAEETIILHTLSPLKGAVQWPWHGNGTSTLGAAFTGLALGYTDIRICGMPLDNSPHYFEYKGKKNFGGTGTIRGWERAFREVFDGKVKVMSGRLA